MVKRSLETKNLLLSYVLRKTKIVLSTEAEQKAVWLSDTDQNNPTSVESGNYKHSVKKKNSHQSNVGKDNSNFQ